MKEFQSLDDIFKEEQERLLKKFRDEEAERERQWKENPAIKEQYLADLARKREEWDALDAEMEAELDEAEDEDDEQEDDEE